MGLVSASQLIALRTIANKGLVTTIVISRPTQTQTAYGTASTYSEVETTLGWLRQMAGTAPGENISFISTTGTFRLHLPYGTDIRVDDRVTVNGNDYSVTDTNADNTIQVYTTAQLRRVE